MPVRDFSTERNETEIFFSQKTLVHIFEIRKPEYGDRFCPRNTAC